MCTMVRSLQHILKLHYIYPLLHVRDHLLPEDDGKIRRWFMYLTTACTFTLYCVWATCVLLHMVTAIREIVILNVGWATGYKQLHFCSQHSTSLKTKVLIQSYPHTALPTFSVHASLWTEIPYYISDVEPLVQCHPC